MAPKVFHRGSPTPLSPDSTSSPPLRPTTSLLPTPRSAIPNETSPLSPAVMGGLVVIGILALICAVGMGFALHIRYCRQSDCSVCRTIVSFTRLRRNNSIPGSYPQDLAGLFTVPLITKLLQLTTTILCAYNYRGTHVQKLRATECSGPQFKAVGCRPRLPLPPLHPPSFTPTSRRTRRCQCQIP